MACIVAAEHLGVESGPHCPAVGNRRVAAGREGVRGGSDADERLAGGDVCPQRVELLRRRSPTADADEYQVSALHRVGKAGENVWVRLVRMHDLYLKPARLQLRPGELGQRRFGLVLVLADHEQELSP